jgi:hypothetical protein
MNTIDNYALMLSGCYDKQPLKKIIGYIDEELAAIANTVEKLNKLKEIAEKRIAECDKTS